MTTGTTQTPRDVVRALPQAAREAFLERCATLLEALDVTTAGVPSASLPDTVAATLTNACADRVWLALAVLSARLPDIATTIEITRAVRLDGPALLLAHAITTMDQDELARVEIATGQTIVDVYQTARMPRSTGIQRVSRQLAREWAAHHDIRLVGWRDDQTALIDLTADERNHLLTDGLAPAPPPPGHRVTVVVPYRGRYLLPELAVGPQLTPRLQGLAEYSRCRTGVVGFDCVPLTSAETTHPGTPSHFVGNLAAVRHMDRIAAISRSAAAEYRGWRTMVGATGLRGPEITGIPLPTEGVTPSAEALVEARERFTIADMPLVLVVGTHEPRKNHEAVLHAAQLLWRKGHRFSLTFVGADGWRSESFRVALDDLQRAGLPLDSVSDLDEDLLWAAYTVAHCTVFPSSNEGYGLPVAESIAVGTPAVTSAFGSMAEVAADGGAVLVDPRDDHAIADGIAQLLEDRELYASLVLEARRRPRRTWADYAAEVWAFLSTEGPATD
ncbi:glycosyltransferase [Actinotalea sp. K2]|uniref:glycosyltransferase n=1 Tax=Actinotalea sp. K2 TaxID=2939438 RepID=UPI002016CD1F|nr:glycosyltransferase [Actinotalea sp. K2]MCL3862721.1 glycosyltransferase [Actinotalea sp. K2]